MPRAPEVLTCWNADARTERAYDQALGGESASLLLTDPPYCLLTRRRKGGDLRDAKDRKIDRGPVLRFENLEDYRQFTRAWLPRAVSRLIPGAPVILWTNFLGIPILREVAAEVGYPHLAGEYTWTKRTKPRGGAAEEWLRVYEVGLVLLPAAPAPLAPDEVSAPTAVLGGYDDDGEAERFGSHPNHKPFSVLEPLVRAYSKPGELVLDCFAGSGSIPSAALRLGRRAACMEIEAGWAERVTKRLREI